VEQAVAQAWNHETLLPIHLPTELRAKVAKSSFVVPDAEPARPASESHPSAAPRDSAPATLLEAPHAAAPAPSPGPLPSLEEHRAAATRHYLEELLRATGADVAEACRVARLSRSRFYALLKEHGLARR